MAPPDIRAEWPNTKRQWRTAALAARRSYEPANSGAGLLRGLAPLLAGIDTVASYASYGSEPSTDAVHSWLLQSGVRILLPILQPDGDLSWARYDGALVPAGRGLHQPPGPDLGRYAVAAAELVLVPALAVDRRGVRLGRGGGSYDRALPRAGGVVIALLHDGELVDRLPTEAHDVRVAGAVTPHGGLVRLPDQIAG